MTPGSSSDRPLDPAQYRQLIQRVRDVARAVLPPAASVLVVSRGDRDLLDIEGCVAGHFPQDELGVYAGRHPADSAEAIEQIEALRSAGADFLLLPASSLWWLDHYVAFRDHLEARYEAIVRVEGTCWIFALRSAGSERRGASDDFVFHGYRALVRQIGEIVDNVLPVEATVLVISKGDEAMLALGGRRGWHFPQNDRGAYAGYYPADSEAAITHLEALRGKGAEFLVVPETASWWLREYSRFGAHLERRYRTVLEQVNVCRIFELRDRFRAPET